MPRVAAAPKRKRDLITTKLRVNRGFKPFVPPTKPPPGWYDPSLDAQQRAAQRGLGDLAQDTEKSQTRATSDFNLGNQRIDQSFGRTFSDRLRYYSQLAGAQQQQGNAAGLLGGGFDEASRLKRQENMDIEGTRLHQDLANSKSDVALAYQRGNEDRTSGLARAKRENTFFGQDVGAQRAFEAAQAGYIPPKRPANERNKSGVQYRTLGHGRYRLPSGMNMHWAGIARLIKKAKAKKPKPAVV